MGMTARAEARVGGIGFPGWSFPAVRVGTVRDGSLAECPQKPIVPAAEPAVPDFSADRQRKAGMTEFPPELGAEGIGPIPGKERHRHGGRMEFLEARAHEDFCGTDGGDGGEGREENEPEPIIPGFREPLGVELVKPPGDPEAAEEEGGNSDPQGRCPSPLPHGEGKEEEHQRPKGASDEAQGLHRGLAGLPARTDGRDIELVLGGGFEPRVALGCGERGCGAEERSKPCCFGGGIGEPEDLVVPEKLLAVDGDASALLPGQGEDGLGCRTVRMQVGSCRGDEAI